MRITPEKITSLPDTFIFVFGSNMIGRHGKGAAKIARELFGAEEQLASGLAGRSYAIPTKDKWMNTLSVHQIGNFVTPFIGFAERIRPELNFYVTKIGCGLAGYKPEQIAPLFVKAIKVENIYLPESFWKVLYDSKA